MTVQDHAAAGDPLFPGFSTGVCETPVARIFYRIGGEPTAPPVVLLHGFPQTGAMWARVALDLAKTYRVIVPDLRGYGRSVGPVGAAAMAKRELTGDLFALADHLGIDTFALVGHDRGGRVAYRAALDMPERISKLSLLDILPTSEYWAALDRSFAMKIYHWAFLAQPAPMPETLIGAAPDFFVDDKLERWAGHRGLAAFDAHAQEQYRDNARTPARLQAMCDDYRAGASIDVEHDLADQRAGKKIPMPTQILWGAEGIAQSAATPLDTWARWCDIVSGQPVDSGHFLPEENPGETLAALQQFLS
ncbi:MAG: alpha/beta hydrolase [Pseudomonadota bacterium]